MEQKRIFPLLPELLKQWRNTAKAELAEDKNWNTAASLLSLPLFIVTSLLAGAAVGWLRWRHLDGLLLLWPALLPLPLSCLLALGFAQLLFPGGRLASRVGWQDWDLRSAGNAVKIFLFCQPLIWLLNLLTYHAVSLSGGKPPTPILQELLLRGSWFTVAGIAVTAIVIAPVAEEIIFRRLLFSFIGRCWGATAALIISSLLFAVIHDSYIHFPALFLFGAAMQLLYLERRSLAAPIIAHALNNLFAISLLLVGRLDGWEWIVEI